MGTVNPGKTGASQSFHVWCCVKPPGCSTHGIAPDHWGLWLVSRKCLGFVSTKQILLLKKKSVNVWILSKSEYDILGHNEPGTAFSLSTDLGQRPGMCGR